MKYVLKYVRVVVLVCLLLVPSLLAAVDLPKLPGDRPGLDEKLGAQVPLDLQFVDETGQAVTLAELVDRPTIIAPVYYRCSNVCNLLQAGLAEVLPQVNVQKDQLRILSVSFDPEETPAEARGSMRIYQGMLRDRFPAGNWHFLTGKQAEIDALMGAIGYHYVKDGRDFVHPVTVAVLSPQGKIVRYLGGTRFLPMDLTLAVMEASEGRIGTTVSRIAQFCFKYDPDKKGYVFNVLRVAGVVVFASAGGLFLFLAFAGRKQRRR